MRVVKSSMEERFKGGGGGGGIEIKQVDPLHTPSKGSKGRLASLTQTHSFNVQQIRSASHALSGKTFTKKSSMAQTWQRIPTNESTVSNGIETIGTENFLLNSESNNKRRGIKQYSGILGSNGSGGNQLNFLGSTNKAQYIDIKTKRIHDLNLLYTESCSADFNSQNVFMNKLVYHSLAQPSNAQSPQANIQVQQPNTAGEIQAQSNQNYFQTNSGSLPRQIVSQNGQTHPRPISFQSDTSSSQLQGLKSFVKTMYEANGTRNLMLISSHDKERRKKISSHQSIGSKKDDSEDASHLPGLVKNKDLFITKIKNTVVTPKFLFFQNQTSQSRQEDRPYLPGAGTEDTDTKKKPLLKSTTSVEKTFGQHPSQFTVVPFSSIPFDDTPLKQRTMKSKEEVEDQDIIKLGDAEQSHPLPKLDSHILVPSKSKDYDDTKLRGSQKDYFNSSQDDIYNLYPQKSTKDEITPTIRLLQYQTSMSQSEFCLPNELKWNYEYLFVFINNLSQVKRKNNLKFCFAQIPLVQNMMSETKLLADFYNLKELLKMRLSINSKDIYLFLDDGTPIKSHMDIVRSENKETRPIFVGGCGGFCGIANLYIPLERKQNLIRVIAQLIDTNQRKKFKIEDFQTVPQQSQTDSAIHQVSQREFQTKEQFLKKENKNVVDKVVNILTHNPDAKIKRFEETFNVPKIKQLTKIEELYDKQLSNFKKSVLEVEASSSLGDNPDIKQTKNLRQIAEFIDGFLEKSFPQADQPIKKALSEYNHLSNNMSKQTETKRNHIKENIEKFNTPAMAMRKISQINRELFIKNIPKILTKYELSRSDLHSIYILYKALLSVSIQRIDWREVGKGGIDFKTFEHGIDKISSQSEEIIRRMCNYENFINWHQFIDILYAVSGKTLESKIDIFIKVADTDNSGNLSRAEISELCYICLDKILPKEGEDDSMVQGLVEYFTRLLFTSLKDKKKDGDEDEEDNENDEIPLHKLKDAIVNGHPENDLLCFFCGVDYTK